MPDFLDSKRREIDDRLRELKPLLDEYEQLETAAKALGGLAGRTSPRAAVNGRRKRGRARASRSVRGKAAVAPKSGTPAKRPPGRRKGSGTRAAEALAVVRAQPGVTIPELAAKMGIQQNYLYRVMPSLERDKKVRKRDKGWHPAD